MTIYQAVQEARGTAALWTSTNPVPLSGQWCCETDTGKVKLGDGVTAWTSLAYFAGAALPTLAQSSISASGTLAVNTATEVTAATALTMTLPASVAGALIMVERAAASAASVAVTGNIRGTAATTVTLSLGNQSELFYGQGGSWWPLAGHLNLASLQGLFAPVAALGDMTYGSAASTLATLPGNTTATRKFLRELGTGTVSAAPAWDVLLPSDIPGATVPVPAPTGATATDTPNVTAAIASLVSALSFGPATLLFQDGTYRVDSNSAVIRSASNFAVRSTGRTVLAQAPNRAGLVNNVTGDIFIIADCTDFSVEGITFDGMRDTVAPITPLTATAASGQPSVTVAAGNGARYQPGQYLCLMGGVGAADQNQQQGFRVGFGGSGIQVSSITPGGGAGGGDLITFTANLTAAWSVTGGTALSDGYGPYAWTSDYLTPYQAAPASTVAGRSLSGEDQQCGLHLLNCQRFSISRCTSRNLWESPFKLGTGFEAGNGSLASGCSQGSVIGCIGYHGYDQGVSLWVSQNISVTGCVMNATGWAGISMTASDYCTVTGNQILSTYYQVPGGLGEGSGIVTEGGVGNQVRTNIISNVYEDGVKIDASPLSWGLPGTKPTLSAFLPAQTAAGASIQVSSTSGLSAGQPYSWLDAGKSEAVTIASIVDGTHLTLEDPVRYSHASGTYLVERIAEDNAFAGNTISGTQTANGITCLGGVRTLLAGNVIKNWGLATGGSGNGIVLDYTSTGVPSGSYIGGYATRVEGNVISGGRGASIRASWVSGLVIRGNDLSAPASSSSAMLLNGVYNSVVEGNHVHDVEAGQGIYLATGGPSSAPCARVAVTGNKVSSTSAEGILAVGGSSVAADSLVIAGNVVSSCGGHAGIDLKGVANSVIADNVSNSNASDGIRLEAIGTVNCLSNRVTGNTARDDGSGINVTTGVAQTQQYGIRELTGSDYNLFSGNECDANSSSQLTVIGAHSAAWKNILSGSLLPPAVTTPIMPATTVAQANATGHDVVAYITGGTVTAITVGATPTGIVSGMVIVPAGQTVTITYSVAPSWTWIATG